MEQRPARFACDVETIDGGALLVLSGELDLSSAPMLRACLRTITDAGAQCVVVDVGGLRFVDASGIRAIAAEARRVRKRNGTVIVRSPRPWTRRLFDVLGATQLVTLEEAPADTGIVDLRPTHPSSLLPT